MDDDRYRARLFARAIAGELAPAMETMLWYYAKGRPKEIVELTGPVEFEAVSAGLLARLTNQQLEVLLSINRITSTKVLALPASTTTSDS